MKVIIPLLFMTLGIWTIHLSWSWFTAPGVATASSSAWIDLAGLDGGALVASGDGAPFVLRFEPHDRSSGAVGAPVQDAVLRLRVEQGGSAFTADRSLTTIAYTSGGRMVFHLWNQRYPERFSGTAPVSVRVIARSELFSEATVSIHPLE